MTRPGYFEVIGSWENFALPAQQAFMNFVEDHLGRTSAAFTRQAGDQPRAPKARTIAPGTQRAEPSGELCRQLPDDPHSGRIVVGSQIGFDLNPMFRRCISGAIHGRCQGPVVANALEDHTGILVGNRSDDQSVFRKSGFGCKSERLFKGLALDHRRPRSGAKNRLGKGEAEIVIHKNHDLMITLQERRCRMRSERSLVGQA